MIVKIYKDAFMNFHELHPASSKIKNLNKFAPAENRTRGPTMATLDFTTKPLALLVIKITLRIYQIMLVFLLLLVFPKLYTCNKLF